MGTLQGYFGESTPHWLVHLYMVETGKSEMRPAPNKELVELRWFPADKLPVTEMIPGDRYWIPRIIRGDKLAIKLYFDKKGERLLSRTIDDIEH